MSGHLSDVARYRRWYSGEEKRWDSNPFPRFHIWRWCRR